LTLSKEGLRIFIFKGGQRITFYEMWKTLCHAPTFKGMGNFSFKQKLRDQNPNVKKKNHHFQM
jgi:hypothetical protein